MRKIAQVLKSNGVEGELLISFLDFDPEDLVLEEPVFIETDGLPVPYFFDAFTRRGAGRALVRLTGVRSLRDADELAGCAIYLDIDETDEEETDLTGWALEDQDGQKVGVVVDYEDIPGNPCLVVETTPGHTVLVPLREELLLDLEAESRTVRIEIPTGLLSL